MQLTEPLPDEGEGAGATESDHLSAPTAEISTAAFFTVKPSELHVRSILGKGAQANVYKAVWTRSFAASTSSIVVAVKRLHSDLGPVYRDREALTLLTDHPNLVKCFDSTVDPPYLVVTEFCSGGSLFDLLYNTRQELSLRQRVKILLDIAAGMRYLHSQNPCILHRDLKSSNVLLMKPIRSSEQEPFAKVADFGLARTTATTSTWVMMTAGVGTWRWMAPEVFDFEESGAYDEKADVFSFAILMYEVLLRKIPYSEQYPLESTDPRIGLHVCRGLRPNLDAVTTDFPQVLADLMQQSWDRDAASRPDFELLERHLREQLAELPPPAVAASSGGL
eukprot:CAMPEP_0179114542 /NCGR_PEP_ID=MMETSP0796-20121207/53639_1 /TAXON_ID=73915 /ORGANISM="Pyrodinium bahamense, Strain pbaha01" /LENGTH=334 /DNA_ID=CAMNT_0020812767 /DNA_START=93 /DNA_END=1097 /DNA_ORIENTATION=+